ncbi:hypothetical protein pipiens_012059 [Culex pipiens pipiens]|uniref:Uncharacterized protein n=1 Tax=Culex pipiens pipiens TaxID=38569 RepID=A0ABD1D6U2_CULPP
MACSSDSDATICIRMAKDHHITVVAFTRRYSSDRMANNNNKNKLLNQRSSKEKDRRGSDCKVTTSLQFKNQTRNKTNEGGLPMVGPGGVAGGQVVHSNSAGALSGSVQSNKVNNAIVSPVGGVLEQMLDQRPVQQHRYSNQLR